MTTLQIFLMALLQGFTELFPISSLGHAVLVPGLLGWEFDRTAFQFLPFLVVLHMGTAIALLLFFWRDWVALILAVLGLAPPEERRRYRHLLLLIVIATIPAAVLGLVLNKLLHQLFDFPLAAALFLALNGVLLIGGERLRRHTGERRIDDMTILDAIVIGCAQCSALLPGISRSGSTMIAGLLRGLHHEASGHFSFLIATPVIIGATILEVPKALKSGAGFDLGLMSIAGLVAGIAAYVSLLVMMALFKKRDFDALSPFGYYCLGAGLLSAVILLV